MPDVGQRSSGMTIQEIWIHPVKSMRGIRVDEAEIDEWGFKYDRIFMVAEPDTKAKDGSYRFVTQRETPRMTLVETSIDTTHRTLRLDYPPTGASLVLPLEISEEALINNPSKPAYIWSQTPESYDLQYEFPAIRTFMESLFWDSPELASEATILMPKKRRVVRRGAPAADVINRTPTTSFQDYYPGNLITTSSLEDLHDRVFERTHGDVSIEVRNFRPNLVVSNTEPWDEDTWKTILINGQFTWYVACRNVRCQVTTVNLKSGKFEKSHEPYKTMQTFRRVDPGAKNYPCFGMNLVHGEVGYTIRVGQSVEVLTRGDHMYESIMNGA